jgi:hypothetical protein
MPRFDNSGAVNAKHFVEDMKMVAEHAHNMLNEFMAQECSAGVGKEVVKE